VPRAACATLACGMPFECPMAARDFRELKCWQLADKLRSEVAAIIAMPEVAKHRRFCDDFAEAAGSVCHNISEGFIRFSRPRLSGFSPTRWRL
jgi:hypothetical protein